MARAVTNTFRCVVSKHSMEATEAIAALLLTGVGSCWFRRRGCCCCWGVAAVSAVAAEARATLGALPSFEIRLSHEIDVCGVVFEGGSESS